MVRIKPCKICRLPEEDRAWVHEHLKLRDKTLREICEYVNTKHPALKLNNTNVARHRDRHLGVIEDEAKKELDEASVIVAVGGEVFSDARKLGSIAPYYLLLKETWDNYSKLKDNTKSSDMAKNNYIASMSKLLEVIHKERLAERDYMTQLNIIKEKHDKATMFQMIDSIKGWFILEGLKRSKTMNEAITQMKDLKDYIQNILTELEKGKDPLLLARELLDTLYGK